MKPRDHDAAEFRADIAATEAAVQSAVRSALIMHKAAGNPIAVWRNGKVEWIPADEIEIPPEPEIARADG
ncbi:MAG: hypothetical protein HYS13_09665 [Planctomycetia bacterium]|nr:hypothetical protein [Planctomycetia bacterium]